MTRDIRESELAQAVREDVESMEWATILITSGILLFGVALGLLVSSWVLFGQMETTTTAGPPGAVVIETAESAFDPALDQIRELMVASVGASVVALALGIWLAGKEPQEET